MVISDAAAYALILGLVLVTSLALLVFGRRAGWPWRRLTRAGLIALETVGATVLLFAANLALGFAAVLLGRRFTPFYASLYAVSDVSLLILSLLQAVVLTWWARGAPPKPSSGPAAG